MARIRIIGSVSETVDARSILVAAPSEQVGLVVERLLKAAGLEPLSYRDASAIAVGPVISDLVARSSGAIAVVPSAGLSPNVAFEVGMAVGAGLPVVVLQLVGKDDPPGPVPADLRSLYQVRWDPSEDPSPALAARLHDLFTVGSPSPSSAPRVVREDLVREFADQTERRVVAALAPVAESVLAHGPGNTVGVPDLAAWIGELPNWANPVLVEVKGRDLSGRSRERAVEQLRAYMAEGRVSLGLVVVPGAHEAEWHSQEGTAIAVLGLETLERLSRHEVVGLLVRGRNLVAHEG